MLGQAEVRLVCFSGFPGLLSQSSNRSIASSHQNLGQLSGQQRAPFPYPGQAPSSLTGSLGYSANLSSAGSDRASPSSVVGRTNLAAQMGFGSNANLQSLDHPPTQLPQRLPEQLTWQQQLLTQQQQHQQQQQAGYDPFGSRNQTQYPDGFQNHHGHHLPAVPTWQNAPSFSHQDLASMGHLGQGSKAVPQFDSAGRPAWAAAQGQQADYRVQMDVSGAGRGTQDRHAVLSSK